MIEIIIALGLILLTLVIFGVAVATLPLTKFSRSQNIAYHLATKKIEELRATPFAGLPPSGGFSDSGMADLPGSAGSLLVANYQGNAQIKKVTAIVSWPDEGQSREVALETLIYNKETPVAPSDPGYALSFDGNNDYVLVPHNPQFAVAEGTVMFWMKMADLSDNVMFSKDEDGCVPGGGDCGHLTIGYNIPWFIPNKLAVRLQNDGNGVHYNVEHDPNILSIEAGNWYHVAVSFGPAGLRLYVNGVEHDANPDTQGMQNNSVQMWFGRYYTGAHPYSGLLDEIRFYNRALSGSEIAAHYNDGSGTKGSAAESGIVGGWHFDEGSGSVTADYSGAGYGGTMLGGTAWVPGEVGF